jgi:hypothetical protein
MLDNEFSSENNVLLQARWVAGSGSNHRSKPVRNPKPFVVIQNAKPIFTVYARSIEQARAIVAARIAGETIVVGPVSMDGASR